MKCLAVLGRQPEISLAEIEALFGETRQIARKLAVFEAPEVPLVARLGGSLKVAVKVEENILKFLSSLPEGKITLGLSDYSKKATARSAQMEALKMKQILVRHGRSVRIVASQTATLGCATSLHNGLAGANPRKVELIKVGGEYYCVTGVQDIDAYAARDQARPARDAKVGMLPPKLAQILINLCGPLSEGARVLDPFCGTGVVLQEALLLGYKAYGTDIEPRMVEYSERNLRWLVADTRNALSSSPAVRPSLRGPDSAAVSLTAANMLSDEALLVCAGDATSFRWEPPIDAVACECFLGQPMSEPPVEIKLKQEMQKCSVIILGFLKNLVGQIASGTPVTLAVPAWLRPNGEYSRLKILDEIDELGYNVSNKSRSGLVYCRPGQVVARDIIILRKK